MNKGCEIGDPYNDLGFLIWQLMKSWQRGKHKLLDEFGLTGSQMEVLSAVYHLSQTEQEVTQIAISNVTNVDPMTTSTILRNLHKKKLIDRKATKIDTRARIVEITDDGTALFLKAINKVHQSTDQLLEHMDGDALKAQLRSLLDVLIKLNN